MRVHCEAYVAGVHWCSSQGVRHKGVRCKGEYLMSGCALQGVHCGGKLRG